MTARKGKPDLTGRCSGKFGGRIGKMMKPPAGEPWIWLTREIIESDAWASLGINARRILDFLLLDHMAHAGTENGNLKATYKQLEIFGVASRYATGAIQQLEDVGLIECHRGGMRVATTYMLTWLPSKDGAPPTDRWRQFHIQKSALQKAGSKPHKCKADGANLPDKGRADPALQMYGPSISWREDDSEAATFKPISSVVPLVLARVAPAHQGQRGVSAPPRPADSYPGQVDLEEAIAAKAAGRQP